MKRFAIKYADDGGFGVMPESYNLIKTSSERMDDDDEIVEVEITVVKSYGAAKRTENEPCEKCKCTCGGIKND